MNGILPSGRKDVPFRRTARRPNPIKIPRERNTRKRVRLYLESKRRERRKVRLEKTVAVCEKWAAESAMKFHETLLYFILILTSLILYIYILEYSSIFVAKVVAPIELPPLLHSIFQL